MRPPAVALLLPLIAALSVATGAREAAGAREAIGIYRSWGAFREGSSTCFAIAEPVEPPANGARPFVAVGFWPADGERAQLHVRLSRPIRWGARVVLGIGAYSEVLVGRGADAWARDRYADANAVANMRVGSSMSISSVSPTGAFADVYRLRGAASAIDAAALACLPGR